MHLNPQYKHPSLIPNKFSLHFFASLHLLSPHSHFLTLNINPKNQPIYLHLQSVHELFFKKTNLPDGSIFYPVHAHANFSF
ncbi:CotH kinase family protein, partial [Priestia megaterium]|uniref:CotH kinase family protein n=1 Tax=Priestia megaterium TaxID=1404 RepID=UPI0021C1DBF7